MLKWIWNSWWRNKERFILLLVGVLIVSIGLSYLVGITEANKGTIVEELQKRWKSSYHMVVRPPDSRSVTEEKKLLEPNYLSGLAGGITLEQYEMIKAMDKVDIAAPIAMLGYLYNDTALGSVDVTEPGIYRLKMIEKTDTGAYEEVDEGEIYFTRGDERTKERGKEYGLTVFQDGQLSYGSSILIAGVDPEAEAKLVGLDEALVREANSRYFLTEDQAEVVALAESIQAYNIPVLMSNQEFVDGEIIYTIEKLDLPFGTTSEREKTLQIVKDEGGKEFLQTIEGSVLEERSFTTIEAHQKIVEEITSQSSEMNRTRWMVFQPSQVEYRPVSSPFADRWPFAYEVTPFSVPDDSFLPIQSAYREVRMFGNDSADWPRIQLDFKGIFDPSELKLSKDPLTELPMETYFPAKAEWVLNKENEPVNPPVQMKPMNNPYGFLTKPPLLLTTLDAAATVLGEKPISAIRVNVKGVEELNEESEEVLTNVANEIEEKTGLIVDITLGSSPQPALTHIPEIDGVNSLGWVQQPWIKLGSSMTIFEETKVGFSGVVASVIFVAIVYVFSSNLIMMYARKKEFAVLLSIGWRPRQLSQLLFVESTLLGILVSIISWIILAFFLVIQNGETSVVRVMMIGICGLFIYWLGSFIPMVLVRRIKPYEVMKAGEVTRSHKRIVRAQSVIGMSLNYLISTWKRSFLAILSIAFPTGLLMFFLFITFRLKGELYTTWLGEYVAMEVGPMHYIAMGIAILIAILTTAEIIWQNVSERQPEIAVLKAIGWRNHAVRKLVLLEGAVSGFLAGILGFVLSLLFIVYMYGQFPTESLVFLIASGFIPVLTGMIGAIIPAEKAVRILPYEGLQGGVTNSDKTEKAFKWSLSLGGVGLFVAVLLLLVQMLPEPVEEAVEVTNVVRSVDKTEGEVTEEFNSVGENSEKVMGVNEEPFEQRFKSAYKVAKLGETIGNKQRYTFGHLTTSPSDVEVENPNNELLSIPVYFEDKDTMSNGSLIYKPSTYKLIDDKGNEYFVKHMKVIESENWKQQMMIISPGKANVVLTYEVPKDVEHLVLIVKNSFEPGEIVVEVK